MKLYRNSIIFSLLILIKLIIYYWLMKVEMHFVSVTLISLILMFGLYILLSNRKMIFLSTYAVLSLLMFVSVVYNRYFHMNFSFNTLVQAKLLGGLEEIVVSLIEPLDFLLFLDVVLLFFALKNEDRLLNILKKISFKMKGALLAIMVAVLIFVIINPLNSNAVTAVNHQEFFSYYVKDLYDTFLNPSDKDNRLSTQLPQYTLKSDGELFGIGKDKNLIVIQVESLQNMMLNKFYNGQEITPNLNKLIKTQGSLYFSSYYQQLGKGNTSDAEFVTNNSLYPSINGYVYNIYQDNTFQGLPWIMKEIGYQTNAFHGYNKEFWNREIAYIGQGFDRFISEENYEITERSGLGLTDKPFFDQSAQFLSENKQPFFSFLITLTSHNPYEMPLSLQELNLLEADKDTLFGNYLQAIHYTDEAIGEFIEELKAKGLYDQSVIAIYGDHFGINCSDPSAVNVEQFLGQPYTYDEMMNIPLIIHLPGTQLNREIKTVGGQIDFMPTILNLMGVADKKLLIFGHDLLNAKEGFVASQTYMLKGSFINDEVVFEMSRSGVFKDSKAWNRTTKEPVDIETCKSGYEKAISEINKGDYVLVHDILKQYNENSGDQAITIGEAGRLPSPMLVINSSDSSLDQRVAEGLKAGYKGIEVGVELKQDQLVLINAEPFQNLINTLSKYPELSIVIDSENNSLKILEAINKDYPDLKTRLIVQIYKLEEYVRVEYFGFENIILNLENIQADTEELQMFIERNKITAVALSSEQLKDKKLMTMLKSRELQIFSHDLSKEQDTILVEK